ncbi:MAG TPA: VCBS repeat-containing protein, partial [Gemmataceae bacterium]|nr:VCBS repeat-containing protein [Gemmataceae bacterium]
MSNAPRLRRLQIDALEDRTVPAYVAAPNFPVVAGTANVRPVDVVAADFNGDGKADAATANQAGHSVSVLLSNGNGTFALPSAYAVGREPGAIKVVDVNRDGKPDLVTANRGDETVSVLIGNGNGTFKPAVHHAVPTDPVDLAGGDFNGDGKVDVAVVCQGANAVTFLLGNTAGTLTAGGSVTVGNSPKAIAVADFNEDDRPDIATVTGDVQVNLNTTTGVGNPTFGPTLTYDGGFGGVDSLLAGDFSGDGRPDLVAGHPFASGDGISLLVGNPDGSFQPPAEFDGAHQP